jgi:hypothetical protein
MRRNDTVAMRAEPKGSAVQVVERLRRQAADNRRAQRQLEAAAKRESGLRDLVGGLHYEVAGVDLKFWADTTVAGYPLRLLVGVAKRGGGRTAATLDEGEARQLMGFLRATLGDA